MGPSAPSVVNFSIERSGDQGATWGILATVEADVSTYTDTSVLDGQSYAYRVLALTTSQTVLYQGEAAVAVPLIAPSGLTDTVSGGSILLQWVNGSQTATGNTVERSDDGGVTWSTLASVGPAVTQFTDTTAPDGGDYLYQVAATAAGTPPSPSTTAQASIRLRPHRSDGDDRIHGRATRLDRPQRLRHRIAVERSPDGVTWSDLATVDASATNYTDTTAADGSGYQYRVQAVKGSLTSDFTAASVSIPLAAPSDLTAVVGSTSVQLTWVDHSVTATGYAVQRRLTAA